MRLPATYEEAQALAFAQEFLAAMQAGDFLGLGCAPLDPEASGRVLHHLIAQWVSYANDSAMFWLVEAALAGWQDAQDVLRDLIFQYTNRHEALPSFLAYYNAKMLAGHVAPKLRGRKTSADFMQDLVLMTLMMELVARFGLKIFRHQLGRKRKPSATSIAAIAASKVGLQRGGEDAMRAIWQELEPKLVPRWRKAPSRLIKKYQ